VPPKPFAQQHSNPKRYAGSSDNDTLVNHEEDALPLHDLQGNSMEKAHYPHNANGTERREALHIPGDMSLNRPGHFKRLDSEAKIGGGHGQEEVEDRICDRSELLFAGVLFFSTVDVLGNWVEGSDKSRHLRHLFLLPRNDSSRQFAMISQGFWLLPSRWSSIASPGEVLLVVMDKGSFQYCEHLFHI